MIKWTTPTLKCTIPSDLEVDYVILSLRQDNVLLEKTIDKAEIENGVFYVTYSQIGTGRFNHDKKVEAQLNIMNGDTRIATNIIELKITKNLHPEVINE